MENLSGAISKIKDQMQQYGYIADDRLSTSLHLAEILQKPILLEGPAGVGKTEIAKILAAIHQTELIRLQCYEGLDAQQAIYEWNYQHQLLHLKLHEQTNLSIQEKQAEIFSESFLLKRPLLKAITQPKAPVLLIDEIDRSDEEFESFFLEILSDWQISIPEIGTIKASSIPYVIITSNRMRELSDALRRRCLYLWIDYPDFDKELAIIQQKLPNINGELARQITAFMQVLRDQRLNKTPGIAETLDWAAALAAMHIEYLEPSLIESTLGVVLKDWKDTRDTQLSMTELFEKVGVRNKLMS